MRISSHRRSTRCGCSNSKLQRIIRDRPGTPENVLLSWQIPISRASDCNPSYRLHHQAAPTLPRLHEVFEQPVALLQNDEPLLRGRPFRFRHPMCVRPSFPCVKYGRVNVFENEPAPSNYGASPTRVSAAGLIRQPITYARSIDASV
jgi:hypothetical protein